MERGQCAVLVASYRVHHAVPGAGRGSVCVLNGIRPSDGDDGCVSKRTRRLCSGELEMVPYFPKPAACAFPFAPQRPPIEVAMFPAEADPLAQHLRLQESETMVKATGFREYDARWLFEKEINLMGMQALGLGLGTLIRADGGKAGNRRRS